MKLEFTPAAIEDLQSISEYTLETWGPKQERIYLESMWTRFEEIQGDPERWRRREDLFPGCQISSQGRHVILFKMQENIIQVVRILHSFMDFKRHIPR